MAPPPCNFASEPATVLIGSFVNASAVARRLSGQTAVHLLCAGTDGKITREDVLCAGCLVEMVCNTTVDKIEINDESRLARAAWRQAIGQAHSGNTAAIEQLAKSLRHTQGGRNLIGMGLEKDIADAAQIDRYDFVPVLDTKHWRITRPAS